MTNMGGGCLNRQHAIRETVTSKQEDLETAVEFVPRPRQQGLSLVAHWLRPKPATMASFFAGADIGSRYAKRFKKALRRCENSVPLQPPSSFPRSVLAQHLSFVSDPGTLRTRIAS